jgi:hypothetical protein
VKLRSRATARNATRSAMVSRCIIESCSVPLADLTT